MITGQRLSAGALWFRRLVKTAKAQVFKQADMAQGFGRPSLHEKMLVDTARCEAYREAILRTVRPGDVVVDLGAGTGLLSYFAVQAGAARVYALEMSRIADVLEAVCRANGMSDRVRLMRGNSMKIQLPERCDVLITETLSDLGFDNENMIDYVNDVHRRMLKPGARVVPAGCTVVFMPFHSDEFGPGRLTNGLYGLDYTALRAARYEGREPIIVRVNGKSIRDLAAPARAWHMDFTRPEGATPRGAVLEFEATADGRVDGVLGWFDADLAPGVRLGNGPRDPEGSWGQVLFPVKGQPVVRRGQRLRFHVTPRLVAGQCEWDYRLDVDPPAGGAAAGETAGQGAAFGG